MVYLPFREEVRDIEISGNQRPPENSTLSMARVMQLSQNIVDKLSFEFDPKNFPNPELQTLYRAIEAKALNETFEPFDDSQTQPDYEAIETKAGYDLYQLSQLFGSFGSVPTAKPVKHYGEQFIKEKVASKKVCIPLPNHLLDSYLSDKCLPNSWEF